MNDNTRVYLAEQLSLVEGGYTEVTAEFTMHVHGTDRTAVINLGLYDTASREPIAVQCPVITFDLGDVQEAAYQLAIAVRQVHALLTPF